VVRVIGIHGSRIKCPVLPLSGTAAGCQEKNAVVTGCDANQQIVKDMSKHTPGPWHSKVVAHVVGVGVFDRRGIHIAQVTSLRSGDDELIAQAPDLKQQRDDLLAELIEAKKLIDNYVDAHQGDYGFTDETAAYNAMVRFNPKSIDLAQGKQ